MVIEINEKTEICFVIACIDPFGIEGGIIPDKAMTSSSSRGPGFEPFHGRLNDVSGNGSWCADERDLESYLQIDLGNRFQVSMIAIQGNELKEFATVWRKQVNCRYVFTSNIIEYSCYPMKMISLGQTYSGIRAEHKCC